jgi:hypothetical protein
MLGSYYKGLEDGLDKGLHSAFLGSELVSFFGSHLVGKRSSCCWQAKLIDCG